MKKRKCEKCGGLMKVKSSMVLGNSIKGIAEDNVMFECESCGSYRGVTFKIDISNAPLLEKDGEPIVKKKRKYSNEELIEMAKIIAGKEEKATSLRPAEGGN